MNKIKEIRKRFKNYWREIDIPIVLFLVSQIYIVLFFIECFIPQALFIINDTSLGFMFVCVAIMVSFSILNVYRAKKDLSERRKRLFRIILKYSLIILLILPVLFGLNLIENFDQNIYLAVQGLDLKLLIFLYFYLLYHFGVFRDEMNNVKYKKRLILIPLLFILILISNIRLYSTKEILDKLKSSYRRDIDLVLEYEGKEYSLNPTIECSARGFNFSLGLGGIRKYGWYIVWDTRIRNNKLTLAGGEELVMRNFFKGKEERFYNDEYIEEFKKKLEKFYDKKTGYYFNKRLKDDDGAMVRITYSRYFYMIGKYRNEKLIFKNYKISKRY